MSRFTYCHLKYEETVAEFSLIRVILTQTSDNASHCNTSRELKTCKFMRNKWSSKKTTLFNNSGHSNTSFSSFYITYHICYHRSLHISQRVIICRMPTSSYIRKELWVFSTLQWNKWLKHADLVSRTDMPSESDLCDLMIFKKKKYTHYCVLRIWHKPTWPII